MHDNDKFNDEQDRRLERMNRQFNVFVAFGFTLIGVALAVAVIVRLT